MRFFRKTFNQKHGSTANDGKCPKKRDGNLPATTAAGKRKNCPESDTESESFHKKRAISQEDHLVRLRSISSKHIEEQSRRGGASTERPVSSVEDNKKRSATQMQQSEPWIETMPTIRKRRKLRDEVPDPTFCIRFEMLSFDTLCGAGNLIEDKDASQLQDDKNSFTTMSRSTSIPSQIMFPTRDSTRHGKLHEEVGVKHQDQIPSFSSGRPEVSDKRPSFFGVKRPFRFMGGRSRKPNNNAARVIIFVDKPKPLRHTNSVDSSTITPSVSVQSTCEEI